MNILDSLIWKETQTIFLLSESKKCRYQNRTLYIKIAQITTLLILLLVMPLKRKAGVARASNLQAARDEEICHAISPFHGRLWSWSEWKTSSLGCTQVQGASSFTTKYIRRDGEAGCCLDDSLKFSYLKKQDLLRHAVFTCHQYITSEGTTCDRVIQ